MVDETKKPPPDFYIRLVGADIHPWSVPMRSLTRILDAVQKLIDQRDDLVDTEDEEEVPEGDTIETRSLRLLSIRGGSAGYAVAGNAAVAVLKDTAESLANPQIARWRPSTVSSLDDLSQLAKKLHCSVQFCKPQPGNPFRDVIARIEPSTFDEVKNSAFYYSHTAVVGRLERVGGATNVKCAIRVPSRRRMLFCNVSNGTLARDLGKHLYSDVVLTGEATWYQFNRQIKSLDVSYFSPAKDAPMDEVLKEIYDAGGKAWDDVADPEEYVREMRR